jgi:hypothetical protein
MRDSTPRSKVDIEAIHLEVAALRAHDLLTYLDGGELHKELLREVSAHHQLRGAKAKLATEYILNVGAIHP